MNARAVIAAGDVRPGDVLLIDPLDAGSAVDVGSVERSQYETTTTFLLVRPGEILSAVVENDALVSVIR